MPFPTPFDHTLLQRPSKKLFTKSIIGSIPKTNDSLRQSRRPSYVNLPTSGLTSPSAYKLLISRNNKNYTFIKQKREYQQATPTSALLRITKPLDLQFIFTSFNELQSNIRKAFSTSSARNASARNITRLHTPFGQIPLPRSIRSSTPQR